MMRIMHRLFWQGVRDLALNPWTQLFTLAAVILVSFLSGLVLMVLTTLNYQLGTVRGETAFQVFWQTTATMETVEGQWQQMRALPGFSQAKTYTPEQAVQELSRRLGRDGRKSSLPQAMDGIPLPATALLYFEPPADIDVEEWIRSTEKQLRSMPEVERVVATPLRDELGQAWRKVSRYVMWPSIAFLSLVLGLVVGNTIRLSLTARVHEVEILKLVGAYNWYIRFPLLVSGALLGCGGGAIGLGLLKLMHLQVRDALNFPPLLMEVQFLSGPLCIALVFVSGFMAIIASWLSVRD